MAIIGRLFGVVECGDELGWKCEENAEAGEADRHACLPQVGASGRSPNLSEDDLCEGGV